MDRPVWIYLRRFMYIRRAKKLTVLVTVASFGIFLCFIWNKETPPKYSNYVTYFHGQSFMAKPVKKILIWTPFLSKSILQNERKCLASCQVKCVVTDNKNEIVDSDAINFHLSDLWTRFWSIGTKASIEFPSYRRADQIWILSNMEPPPHLWGDLKMFNNVFNWTMWYRKDATIGWLYGSAKLLSESEVKNATLQIKGRNFYKEKQYEIFGRVSNCADPGRRYRIIKELQRYLDIDMYGLCYNRPCGNPRDQWDKSCDRFMKKFKFYIAFENSACRDYITEKYWWALHRNQIPIVNWKNVDKTLPIPGSFINIYDFPDLESFANYIKLVSSNATLYNSYFGWKMTYKDETMCSACTICHALHDESRKPQVISNLDGWVRDDTCEKVGVFNNVIKQIHAWLFWNIGV